MIRGLFFGFAVPLLSLLAVTSCEFESVEHMTESRQAATATIEIRGRVHDASGIGLANIRVTLAGSRWIQTTTDPLGNYQFADLQPGSYSVRPDQVDCNFAPDVVNLNNLKSSYVQDYLGQGTGCSTAGRPAPIARRHLNLVFNPVLENRDGERLIDYRGYNDPEPLIREYVADLAASSHQIAEYSSSGTLEIDGYPVKEDGFQYDDVSFLACLEDPTHLACHKPDQADGYGYAIDYVSLLNQYNLCTRFNAGEFDEVWLFGAPFMGFWEAVQAGSSAIETNGPIIAPSTCVGRMNVMGFSYERGVAEMLEDFAHRAEGTLRRLMPPANTLFAEFSRYDVNSPGQAQCGTVHFAPNSTSDYDWSNPRIVQSSCEDWLNYPNRTGKPQEVNCTAWSCDARQHKIWWLSHMPAVTGSTFDGASNNWWTYLLSR